MAVISSAVISSRSSSTRSSSSCRISSSSNSKHLNSKKAHHHKRPPKFKGVSLSSTSIDLDNFHKEKLNAVVEKRLIIPDDLISLSSSSSSSDSMIPPSTCSSRKLQKTQNTVVVNKYSYVETHPSRLYKIIVVGEVACGKSALIKRYVHNYFGKVTNYRATIGVDFQLKLLKFNDELDIRLQLWDIAGQERFSSMTRAYYKGAVGAVVMFDQTDVRTFHAAFEKWKADIDEKVLIPGGRKIPVLLVCNKSDLPKDPRLPTDLEISRIVQEYNFIPKWFKTSAKNGEGVKDAFNVIVRYIMAMDTWNEPLQDPDGSLESSFASYPGSISWLQEQHQQQSKDEVFEANNENVVRLDSRRRSANNIINRRKCC